MKRYRYTCKTEAEREFLAKTATVFGYFVRNLDWTFLSASTFAGRDGGFALCMKDSAMADESVEVANIGEMVKAIAGMTEIKEFVEPEPIWKIGCHVAKWVGDPLILRIGLQVGKGDDCAVEAWVPFSIVKEIYERGLEKMK